MEGKGGSLNKNSDFRAWHCGRQGGGRKWVGWGALLEAQVIGLRRKWSGGATLSKAFLKHLSNLAQTPFKPFRSPLEALLKPPPSGLEALFTLKPPSSPSQAPETLLKPPSAPLKASFTLKPHWSPSQAPWSPLEALLKPPWSPSQAPFKLPSEPSPSSPLQALLKPPWSPLN